MERPVRRVQTVLRGHPGRKVTQERLGRKDRRVNEATQVSRVTLAAKENPAARVKRGLLGRKGRLGRKVLSVTGARLAHKG